MNERETLEYLRALRQRGMSEGTAGMERLAARLGNPQNLPRRIIHIAGTNGKGSAGAFIEAALASAGYSVGRYSSPAVFSRCETIRKNLKNISPAEFAETMTVVKNAAEEEGLVPSEFEAETAAAFLYVKDCDFAVIEAGLGGRGDSTNIITAPKTAVIMPVSLDHTAVLGSTVERIAAEKCGIFNSRTTVVVARQERGAEKTIEKYADGLELIRAEEPRSIRLLKGKTLFDLGEMKDVEIRLAGAFQPFNAAAAAAALKSLGIPEKHIRDGLKNAVWHGRFEFLEPNVIADGAHNEQAFYELRKSLELYFPGNKFTFIAGIFRDKDYAAAARILSPVAEKVFTVTPKNPRALEAAALAAEFKKYGADAEPADISDAGKIISEGGVTVSFGSLSFLSELRDVIKNRKQE